MPSGHFVQVISLQGVDEVISQLKKLGPAGEQAMNAFRDSTAGINVENLGQSVNRASNSVRDFRDGLHIFHPILRAAGIEMGNFTAFSRAAGAGIIGLGVAITGGIIIALSKLDDKISVTKAQFANLLNVPAGSPQSTAQFKGLEDEAKRLGTTVENILPVISAWTSAADKVRDKTAALWIVPPGQSLPAILGQGFESSKDAALTFYEALRVGGRDIETAGKDAIAFANAWKTAGKLTGDVVRALDPLGAGLKTLEDAFHKSGLSAEQFAQFLDKNPQSVKQLQAALITLKPELDRTFADTKKPTAFSDALAKVGAAWADLFSKISSSSLSLGLLDVMARIPDDMQAAFEAIKRDVQDLWNFMNTAFSVGKDFIMSLFTSAPWSTLWDGLKSSLTSAIDWLRTQWQTFLSWFQSSKPDVNLPTPQGSGGGGFAGGGFITGPGTSTSDSILARLSTGEFVVQAQAVRMYGVDLLRAINSMRLPRDFLRGFNVGGLVENMAAALAHGPVPRFAGGGLASGNMRPVTLVINGQQFGGLHGSSDAVAQLERFAVFSNMRATGRSPSWNK